MTDLVAGNIQAIAIGNATVAPFVEPGTLRILAVAGPRAAALSAGRADGGRDRAAALGGRNLVRRCSRRAARRSRSSIELNGHILAMFDDPANKKRYDESFYDTMRLSADEFAARVRSDVARWERIVKETGIEAQ